MLPPQLTKLLDAARARYGARADRVAGYLFQTDPLADNLLEAWAERRKPPGHSAAPVESKLYDDEKLFDKALQKGHAAFPEASFSAEFREFFRYIEEVPHWVDSKLLELGGNTYLRCGAMPALVLGVGCLPLAYLSEIGNKPLAYTGKLKRWAPRRLNKTGEFFLDSCTEGSLLPFGSAWRHTVKVRKMHAQMRRNLLYYDPERPPRRPWRVTDWGQPINQLYLAGTGLLFSVMSLVYLRRLGFHFSAREGEAVLHLWRYASYLLGIEPELVCATEKDGLNLVDMVLDLSSTPDNDSRELIDALMEKALPALMAPRPGQGLVRRCLGRIGNALVSPLGLGSDAGRTRFSYGLSQCLLGRHADGLNYPKTLWRYTAPVLIRSVIAPLELCRRCVPGGTRLATYLGRAWFSRIITKTQE
jgi:hypothetical protein